MLYDNAQIIDLLALAWQATGKPLFEQRLRETVDWVLREMIAAGIGAQVTVDLGGKLDMPSIGRKGEPRRVSGTVKLISNGQYRNRGPAQKGILQDMGPTVVLDTGKVEIVVISRHQEPNDLACFLSLGIDPHAKRYLMLKSRIHYRAGFRDVAKEVIECAGVGVCTSDYDMLDFNTSAAPIYPPGSGE